MDGTVNNGRLMEQLRLLHRIAALVDIAAIACYIVGVYAIRESGHCGFAPYGVFALYGVWTSAGATGLLAATAIISQSLAGWIRFTGSLLFSISGFVLLSALIPQCLA